MIKVYVEALVDGQMVSSAANTIPRTANPAGRASRPHVWGPAPETENDFAQTPEEAPVVIEVLANDKSGSRDDDDDDDDDNAYFRIDRSTVDLDPDTKGIQTFRSTGEGDYHVNDDGQVTFRPAENYFGSTSARYTVNSKAGETSNIATISVTVTNVNDAPAVGGWRQGPLVAVAGAPVTITPEDLVIADPDNHAPTDFSVTVLPGDHYTASGNTAIPEASFSGDLPILVQVHDGVTAGEPSTLGLRVAEDNTKPVITGQNPDPLTTAEDEAIIVTFDHLTVTDPDDSWPSDFTITLGEGDNYTLSGHTVTPARDFSGMLAVPVRVNDGEDDSEPYSLKIAVTEVNDRPVITGQRPDPLSTGHNQPLTIVPDHLLVTDPDHVYPSEFTLTVMAGENYTVSGNTITPSTGFAGPLSVNVTVSDPVESSAPFALNVSVAANSKPVITAQVSLSTNEETPLEVSLAHVSVSDPDDTYPGDFTFRMLSGDNYVVDGSIVTPAVDFHGLLTVPIIVNDGTNDSDPYDLQITVQPVNDAPGITGQVSLSTSENQPVALSLAHFAVEDPDNSYPEDFTLAVMAGENYAVSGTEITPSTGYTGTLQVPVLVNDGSANSPFFEAVITVNPVNDRPTITGQRPLETAEDAPILLSLQDITVVDPDNAFPADFTLIVQEGSNYSFSGTTVTPAADFTGTLAVNIVVSDGQDTSAPFALQISVVAVNDGPVITGQQPVITNEDIPRTISTADLVVEDPDNAYPAGFSLSLFAGENYALSENTVVPAQDYAGTLTVPVQVTDGSLTSNVFDLTVQVTPVNDAPVITGQVAVRTDEDVPVTIALSHLTVFDVDNTYPAGFALIVSPGTNYSVSGQTITPAADFNGTLNVDIVVNDGTNNSSPFVFQIQVGNANDAPVITGQTPLSTDEETAVTLELSHLQVSDPDNVFPEGFSLLISPGVNYSVSGQTITPALNYAGTLTIPVRVNDGVNNSPTFDFQLQVNQVNDPPFFGPIANQQLAENASAASLTITDISKGPMEEHQQLTFVGTSSNTAIVDDPVIRYDGTSETAVLSYAPKPNASGVVTITIVAIDNGSSTPPHHNSYSSAFQVEILEINTAPTLDDINDITLMEDAEEQHVALTGITAGAGEEQALSVSATADKPGLLEFLEVTYTSPQTAGQVRLRPAANAFGTVRVSVTVTDNGAGVSPHRNTVTKVFKVVIQPVNDPPVFTSTPLTLAVVQESYEYRVSVTDADGDRITLSATTRPDWASLAPSGNGTATLKGKPPGSAQGTVAVVLEAKDAHGAVQQSFDVYVNVRPALSSLSIAVEEDNAVSLAASFFESGYTDANEDPMQAIRITTLPTSGRLLLSDVLVKAGDTIATSSLSGLRYMPNENFAGTDFFGWHAFDGNHFSLTPARVDLSILSVNDVPLVVLEQDTLHYEVSGEPEFISPLIAVHDPDDDTLTHAVVGFHARNYHPQIDMLEFQNTVNIRGSFDLHSGTLQLTGTAPVQEYVAALRSVRYLHQNTVDPVLQPKALYFSVHDGEGESERKDKIIMLQYTFVEFEIPTGFTPNGDQANDTWVIDRPGGGLEEMDDAIISVYNKRGVLVFRSKGFGRAWDGTMNGERLPADTYFYTIDLQLRNKKRYKGIVTILR